MKASTGSKRRGFIARNDSPSFMRIRQLLKGLRIFFAGSFEADWEKKTGQLWREWGKYSDKNER